MRIYQSRATGGCMVSLPRDKDRRHQTALTVSVLVAQLQHKQAFMGLQKQSKLCQLKQIDGGHFKPVP